MASFDRSLRPVPALLFAARRALPNGFWSHLPSGPGAVPAARWPVPSVRSTPRCGQIDSRGATNASTRSTMQITTTPAMIT